MSEYLNAIDTVEEYMLKEDWRVTENSNAHYSYGALNRYISGKVSALYWLNKVYPQCIAEQHVNGFMHIHDLSSLSIYCSGYSIRDIAEKGIRGISNIPTSAPPKHFMSLLNQITNITTIYQNEISGAVAFSSFDTLTAPFVKEDKLTYEEVKQYIQNLIYSINSNSRGGSEPAFSNFSIDLTPPKDLLNQPVIVGGKLLDYTYKECQKEMDMINRAIYEIMLEGDYAGAPFAYPILTYNIHDRFDWDNPNNELLWQMTGKYGLPYFANFINSDMEPSDVRSMCCRLRLSLSELRKRGGGLFGSGEHTGSIGVVTLNLPRYAYLAKKMNDETQFWWLLKTYMDIAMTSLEYKRGFLQEQLDRGLLPAFSEYVGGIDNYFSTIGLVGMNEMCLNLLGVDITDPKGKAFSERVLDYMRERIIEYQEQTGNLYNLEATPAEGCSYRLAKMDVERFNDIIVQGTREIPYYTNSCHMPVNKVETVKQLMEHQEGLQLKFTGGTVVHLYLSGAISGDKAKHIVRTVCENYRVPYISLSPVYSICPNHGYLSGYVKQCPICQAPVESYQRVTGYIRQISKFNDGKKAEFHDRKQLEVGGLEAGGIDHNVTC